MNNGNGHTNGNGRMKTLYQDFIHLSRYARWLEDEGRRETWAETVDRYVKFMCDVQCKGKIPLDVRQEIRDAIYNLEVMPSMRCMMTAGPALERDNVAGYNCAYVAIDNQQAFDEILYVLMCGTGVGFSVERQFIAELPAVAERFRKSESVITVRDSKIGWSDAYRELISMLYSGVIPKWDVSQVRPAGERLNTFGGRASGPEPLEDLLRFTIATFKGAAGRKLTSLECHDLICKIGDVVVVGGVRRSAEISLSNPSDDRMRHAKSGDWNTDHGYRQLANNSACYTEKPEMGAYMREWEALYESKSGERGIFNRQAAKKQVAKHGRRDPDYNFGCNPCSEIILRSMQFCNLSEVVVRPEDTEESIKKKVRLATIMGTMQATLTKFRYLRQAWEDNTREEALLGVSLTGILDNDFFSGLNGSRNVLPGVLDNLRKYAVEVNAEWAGIFGINPSTAITCVKPSGTVSQLVDSASGIHARHSEYYIRTVRADKKDPLCKMMVDLGFPVEDVLGKESHMSIFSFPVESPEKSITGENLGALDHLEVWKLYQDHWCEHKPSCTVNIRESEWMDVGAWVFKNFDEVSGIAFMPYSGHTYRQAPYQECSKEDFEELTSRMPTEVDWSKLKDYEEFDQTSGGKEYACTGDKGCEIVDLVGSQG